MMQRLVQLALDLFDPPGPQERAAGASPSVAGLPTEKIKPERPVALIDKAQEAPETGALLTAATGVGRIHTMAPTITATPTSA